MKKCTNILCFNEAKFAVYLITRCHPNCNAVEFPPTAFVCNDHMAELTFQEMIPDSTWEEISEILEQKGYSRPDKKLSFLVVQPFKIIKR